MILQQLNTFVKNPTSYEEGLKLYKHYKRTNDFDQFFDHPKSTESGSMHFKMLIAKLKEIIGLFQRNPVLMKNFDVAEMKTPEIKVRKITAGPLDIEKLLTLFQASVPLSEFEFHEKTALIKHFGLVIKGRISNEVVNQALTEYRQTPETFVPKDKGFRIVENFDKINYEDLSDEMKLLYDEIKVCVKEAGVWHSKAKGLENISEKDEERKEAINKAIELDQKREENWNAIQDWFKTKDNTAPAPKSAVIRLNEIKKLLGNLATNISKTSRKISDTPNDPKVKKWRNNLEKFNLLKKELENEEKQLLADGSE